jgi:hypothetical protein
MGNIVGRDRQAEHIARRNMPSIEEARRIVEGVPRARLIEIAERRSRHPESLTEGEMFLLVAAHRVHAEDDGP